MDGGPPNGGVWRPECFDDSWQVAGTADVSKLEHGDCRAHSGLNRAAVFASGITARTTDNALSGASDQRRSVEEVRLRKVDGLGARRQRLKDGAPYHCPSTEQASKSVPIVRLTRLSHRSPAGARGDDRIGVAEGERDQLFAGQPTSRQS